MPCFKIETNESSKGCFGDLSQIIFGDLQNPCNDRITTSVGFQALWLATEGRGRAHSKCALSNNIEC